jgi:hypothetical protein
MFTRRFWTSFQEALGIQLKFSTMYHPEIDRKIERMNQILEYIFCMYLMDQQKRWEEFFPLVEFVYNNNYHRTIKMAPFDFLYEKPCQTPLSWDRLEDRVLVGPEVIQEMEDKIQMIRCNILLLRAHVIDLFFEDTCMQVIRF